MISNNVLARISASESYIDYFQTTDNCFWVFRIRIRKFLGLSDPDPLVGDTYPDLDADGNPSIINQI